MQFALFFLFLALVQVAYAAKQADEVVNLPGWNGALPSKQYSGYLAASGGSNLHYWFVSSEKAPESAPTVLWLNGGPGCSSLDGFIYEMGPFEVQDDNTLVERPHRWNKEVNMLYIEAPVGVGFSYNSKGDYKCDDDRTAQENMEAVEAFFASFPEFKNSKGLYLVGESYAGVYVPTLAEAIVKSTKEGTYTGATLKGIAVGNGCSGTEVGICGNGPQGTAYEWGYLMQTAFVSNQLKLQINKACDWEAAVKNEPDSISAECVGLLNQASVQIGHVNMYDIYGDCVSDSGCPNDAKFAQTYLTDKVGGELLQRGKVPHRSTYEVSEGSQGGEVKRMLGPRIVPHGPDACINSKAASSYLNQPAVQKALNVLQQESESNGQTCWSVCGTAPGWSYNSTRTNLPRDTYPLLVSNIRVTVYNGDWDACVPFTDGEGWTSGMQLPVKKPWHSWAYTSLEGADNQVAGYATEYDVSEMGEGSFQFITVKGGRHEVPETAPAQAYEMISRITSGEVF